MSKIKINKRTEYEMVIPTNTFGGEYRYKTDGEGYWEFHDSDCWEPLDDEKSLLLELIFQTHKGDTMEEPSNDDNGEEKYNDVEEASETTFDEDITQLSYLINLYRYEAERGDGKDNKMKLINYMKKMIEWNK
jgi:hypothetical protein